ncbi:MAG TPA: M14 family zinc carboxypeptidase, partial [Gemmatimonadales bacterium]|nr:M14 family zinc carboxypeptidase [Gemmatimonadales bacterium]
MSILHVAITGKNKRHLAALGPKLRVVVAGFREDKHGAIVDAYVRSDKVEWLKRQGYGVTRLEAIDAPDRTRQAQEHAAVNRRLKKGRYGDVIWGGGYLSVDEVEKAIVIGEQNHGAYFERIALPNLTWEKRRVHACRIGKGNGKRRPAVCFIGGVHGREWGGPDILIYFAVRLLRAYRDKQGFGRGKRRVSAAQVRRLVETMDIVLLPQVNP